MKKGIYYLSSCFLLCFTGAGFFSCDTPDNIEDPDVDYFVKYYGGNGNQEGVDMLSLNDGTFLLLGNYAETPFNQDIYLVKVDAEGEVIWEVRIGESDDTHVWNAKDIEPTIDGNFVVLADFQAGISAFTDIRLLKVSQEGQLLDSAGIGTVAPDHGLTVSPAEDGSFIVSGTTELTDDWNVPGIVDPDVGNFLHYAFDADLNKFPINWARISGFNGRIDVAVKAFPFLNYSTDPPTLSAYVFGYSENELFDAPEITGLFYFLHDQGQAITNFSPGPHTADTEINFVLPAAAEFGGGFLAVGFTAKELGQSSIFVGKVIDRPTFKDSDKAGLYGNLSLSGNLRGVSAANALFGQQGYLILGNEVRGTGATNIWLTKIDQSQQILWSTTIGSEAANDTGAAVAELPDGKIVILGTMGMADNQSKMAFIKMNRQGKLVK
jgi:hypothetical protein